MGTDQWIHLIQRLDYAMVIKGGSLFLIGLLVASLASHWTKRALGDRLTDHQKLIAGRLSYYAVLFIFIISALKQFGFETDALLTLAGIVAVALGFAAKDSMGNLVSGFFLMAERPVSIGDKIIVNGNMGYVASIDLFSIKIRTLDNAMIRMSNVTFLNSEFINHTRYPLRRVDITFYLEHTQDINAIRHTLLNFAKQFPQGLSHPVPEFFVLEVELIGLKCKLGVWVETEHYTEFKTNLIIGFNEVMKNNHYKLAQAQTTILG